jgi:hypothetical protein
MRMNELRRKRGLMAALVVVAHALTGNNPVLCEAFRNLVDRTLDTQDDTDTLLFEELDGSHPHPTGKDMGYAPGSQQTGEFSRLMPGADNTFLVNYLVVPDMIDGKFVAVTEV